MTIDKQEIKALVDRVKTDRRFCADENHHVLADGVLALLAEIERLEKFEDWFVRLDQAEQSLSASFKAERDQLKAENEALRKDAERYRWLRKPWQEQRQVKAWTSLEVMDENIDAAMTKEASHE